MTTLVFRFRSLSVLLALVLLAACGSAATQGVPAATPPAPAPTTAAATEAPVATEAPAAAADRVIETRYGPVTVPAAPQRVVTLDEGALDTALAVGVTPVGAISSRLTAGVAPYLADQVPGIAIVGSPAETNFEAVVAAAPDLILTGNRVDEETFKNLSAIAPTIVPTNGMAKWQDAAREYAAALGRSAELDAVLVDVDAQISALRAKLAIAPGTTGAVIRWMPQGPLVMGRLLTSVGLLEQLGLALPQIALDLGTDAPHTDVLSLEQLSATDTDWLFVATFNAEGDQALAAVREQAAFSQLKAAQSEQVVSVNAQLWSSAFGPIATQQMLADIERGLLAGE